MTTICRSPLLCALAISAAATGWNTPANANDRLGPFDGQRRSVRSREFDQRHVRIELDLDWEKQLIQGRVEHELVPFRPLSSIELDAVQMEIKRAQLLPEEGDDAKDLKFEHRGDTLMIHLPAEVPADERVCLAVDYRVVRPQRGGHFVIPDEMEPDQPRMFWTQSESEYARYWFPCHDSPADRLTSETAVTVPEGFFVLSNGELTSKSKPENGRQTYRWKQKRTHVPYLVSVVAGEFEAYEQSWDSIPVVSYVPKGRSADAERSFGKTAEMVKLFSEKIGFRYPWPKYTQICVEEYGWGGMEHTSATTLASRTLHDERAALDQSSVDLVAHELAHQWWGDLITCKDWAELWLNESFATYFELVWTEHDKGWDETVWQHHKDAQRYLAEDRNRYRRPIVTYRYPRPDSMFDSHSYPKGACVLHMLRHVLGDRMFWNGIRRYAYDHQFGVAETADLRTSFEAATGQGLNWFFDQWIHHGGHPEYKVRYRYDEHQDVVRMTIEQTQTVDELTPLFRMPVEIEIVTPSETITRRVTVDQKTETFTFDVPQRPDRVLFDPRDWILKTLDFEKSKQEWMSQLRHDKHVMCRARAARGLASHHPDADAEAALIRAAKEDAFWAVRMTAVEALDDFDGDDVRSALIEIAKTDKRSDVRRAAVSALKDFSHDDTRSVLRQIIADDRSYYVIADALRTLAEVDADGCRDDLRAALDLPSHSDVIVEAAAESLAEIGDDASLDRLLAMFEPPSSITRRGAVLTAIAKLGGDDKRVKELLQKQLKSDRRWYRMAAARALGRTGDASMVAVLLTLKEKETSRRARQAIDDAIEDLREDGGERQLRRRVETLERDQQQLQRRLQELKESKE